MTLAEIFLAAADARGDAPALIDSNGRGISFAALAQRSAQYARAYSETGIGAGDVVLVAQGVSSDLYANLLALFRIGAVAAFPEPGAGLDGVRHAIAATTPRALIAGARAKLARTLVPELARLPVLPRISSTHYAGDGPLAPAAPHAPALITFTSGSTGAPKGIVRSAQFLLMQHTLLERVRATTPEDIDLISLPVFILSNLAAGAASVIPVGDLRRPADMDGARLRRQLVEHNVTRIVAPPALCARIADAPLPGIRAIFTGGGPVFPNLWRTLHAAAPAARICAVYGSTEAEPIAHVDWTDFSEKDWNAMAHGAGLLAGRPIAEIALHLEDGEIEVAGPHVNRTYLNRADDATTKVSREGLIWHRTGDSGRLDEQGRLWLLGRTTAAASGHYPFAIETAALSWPGVRQAALLAEYGRAHLAVAGARLDIADLRGRARALGVAELTQLRDIPTDRRHNSKVDYARLRTRLSLGH